MNINSLSDTSWCALKLDRTATVVVRSLNSTDLLSPCSSSALEAMSVDCACLESKLDKSSVSSCRFCASNTEVLPCEGAWPRAMLVKRRDFACTNDELIWNANSTNIHDYISFNHDREDELCKLGTKRAAKYSNLQLSNVLFQGLLGCLYCPLSCAWHAIT